MLHVFIEILPARVFELYAAPQRASYLTAADRVFLRIKNCYILQGTRVTIRQVHGSPFLDVTKFLDSLQIYIPNRNK